MKNIIALTMLFLFSACGGDENEPVPVVVTTMSGKVVTQAGTPIPKAKVLAAGREVVTNDKGVYSDIKITHRGSFTIAAFAEGYETRVENIAEKTSRTLEKEITLDGVDKTKPLIVTPMSGKVLTKDTKDTKEGTPIPNAKVLAAGKEVITNDKGVYSIEITHQGSFTIAASASGYKTGFENITQNKSGKLEKEIRLDFAYKVKITGKVTGPDDKPIEGAEVQAFVRKGEKPLVDQTKADGTYELLLSCASPPILIAKKCSYCSTVSIGITRAALAARIVTRNFKLRNSGGCEVVSCK